MDCVSACLIETYGAKAALIPPGKVPLVSNCAIPEWVNKIISLGLDVFSEEEMC